MLKYTKGNVIVEQIKIGDIHYEYDCGIGIKSKVITLPKRDDDGCWTWQNVNEKSGRVITYAVTEGMGHYSANLYDYEAYTVNNYV